MENDENNLNDSGLSDNSDNLEQDIPAEIEAILGSVPPDQKKHAERLVIEKTFGMLGIGQLSQENEIAKKITESHITDYLQASREQMQNTYQERHERKIFTFGLVALALLFFIAIIVLLDEKTDILEKIIYSVTGLVAGAFGGYGFGRNHKKDDD